MKTGEAPKIVERSSLPPELQKTNSFLAVASNMIYQTDLEEVKLQPKIGKVLKLSDMNKGADQEEEKVWDNALDLEENKRRLGDKAYLNSKRNTGKARRQNTDDSINVGTPRDPSIALRSDVDSDDDTDKGEGFVIDDESPQKSRKVEVAPVDDIPEDTKVKVEPKEPESFAK